MMDFATTQIAELFQVESPSLIEKWIETAPKYWSSTTLLAWMYLGTCLLQVANRPIHGLICAFVGQTVVFPVVSWIWYSVTHNGVEMFWSGLTNDTVAFALTMLFDIPVFIEIIRRRNEMWESLPETGHERLP
jgi:Na+-driven multidrug efflux pump